MTSWPWNSIDASPSTLRSRVEYQIIHWSTIACQHGWPSGHTKTPSPAYIGTINAGACNMGSGYCPYHNSLTFADP
jgi:hypothetical protein